MKFLRFLICAVLLPLFFACENEPITDDPQPAPSADQHKIPVEKALADLQSMLQVIDGAETRSGSARRVASVRTLRASDITKVTRAGSNTASDIGDLVYIANFENDEGYAILGADDRVTSVIAVTEQGNLTPEQLKAAANGEYDDMAMPPILPEVGYYLGGLKIRDSLISGVGGGGGDGFNISDLILKEDITEFIDKKGPYCKMKWGQDAPYNNSCPVKDGQSCLVGCVAVALGQIIATNYYDKYYPRNMNPEPKILGGRPIRWDIIFGEINRYKIRPNDPRYYTTDDKTPEVDCVADLLSGIGFSIGMKFGVNKSSADHHDACRMLKAVGFNNVEAYYFDTGKLKEMVIDRGLPTYIRGYDDNLDKGHAWVVDGAVTKRQHYISTNKKTGEVRTYSMDVLLYHCNFGWSGFSDGYYHPDAVMCPRNDVEWKEVGDRDGGMIRNYTSTKRIIYYNRKN